MENKKNVKGKLVLAGIAATAAYSAVTGKGPFNKYRFKKQHEILSKYVDTNYPDCTYSNITQHGKGWTATILRMGKPLCFVYFTKNDDGTYIFTVLDEKIK